MKLVVTSTNHSGSGREENGALYRIDLDSRSIDRPLAPRVAALRGIAFDGDVVYLARSDMLFAYGPDFRLLESWSNPYLRECREIAVHERTLYVVAAGYDSVLGFDLDARKFTWAMHVATQDYRFAGRRFDPGGKDGPLPAAKLELDSVHCNADGMYISGIRSGGMLHFNGKTIRMAAELPAGSRNARPFRNGALFNDTDAGVLRYAGRDEGREDRAMRVPNGSGPAFARGLCVISDSVVAGGSSPATVTLYDLAANRQVLSVRLSHDVQECIHSIAVWPYG